MNAEQQALKRMAEAREKVGFSHGIHNIFFFGKGIPVEEFKNALNESIRLGNTESEEAVEGEIKLGWYRSNNDNYPVDFEVVAIRGDVACVWSGCRCFLVLLDVIRKREYLGTERPPKGRWVDFDPSKVTCDMFPIEGKAYSRGEWQDTEVVGFRSGSAYPFMTIGGDTYERFQIWEEE